MGRYREWLQHEVELRFGVTPEVRPVEQSALVPADKLLKTTPFLKPRFLFQAREDWTEGLLY